MSRVYVGLSVIQCSAVSSLMSSFMRWFVCMVLVVFWLSCWMSMVEFE